MSDRCAFRQDIQTLRGVAVLLVLLFHAQIGGIAAGYLGVDLFFVLSGYLITGLVHRRLLEDRFSFAGFFLDRAKRLLPAAYVVYGATAIAANWFLTDSEFDRLLETLWGALTFTANITLWMGTDYFAPGAKFNALLHVWSLSIEEQFYFLLPLALFLTPSRHRLTLVAIGGASSLALCIYFAPRSPVATFFLLPTRAWELALGGALALAEARRQARGLQPWAASGASFALSLAALVVVLLTPAFGPGAMLGFHHPGLDAILVSFATGLLLFIRFPLLAYGPVAWVLARVGDVSYSLYLVHWPLFAFATNAYVGETAPFEVRAGLLLVSLMLAFLLFHLVEEPIRRRSLGELRLYPFLGMLAATSMVAVLAGGVRMTRPTDALPQRSANHGLSQKCVFKNHFQPLPECTSGAAPETLLWGDSFAMHLAPGLAALDGAAFLQAAKSACAPIRGIAPYRPTIGFLDGWARDCLAFNESVFAKLAQSPKLTRVVLSSPFSQFIEVDAVGLVKDHTEVTERSITVDDFSQSFKATVVQIQSLGKEVVIVSPTPASGFDVGLCHERKAIGVPNFGPYHDCQLAAPEARAFRELQMSVLGTVAAETGARLVDLAEHLCDDETCRTEIDGVPLYWDAGHFSTAGSRKVVTATGVGAAITGDAP